MTGFSNGEKMVYSNKCGLIDGLKLYDEKIGINWKWQSMEMVQ
jgi:hypothetical protein